MQIRSFSAATMAEAMAMIRKELGEEAMIVSTEKARRGRGFHVQAATTAEVELPDLSTPIDTPENIDTSGNDGYANERTDTAKPEVRKALLQQLAYHGVPEHPGLRLLDVAAESGAPDLPAALGASLQHRFDFRPLAISPERPLALVGPAGAGKTLTVAKLATRAALRGLPMRLITTDVVRAGAVEQLDAYARLLNYPVECADSVSELASLLREDRDTPTLIDTAGVNPFDSLDMQELAEMSGRGDVELILTLPAGGDVEEAADIAGLFSRIGCSRFLATRLDCARRLGGLITAAEVGGLAFSHAGISPDVADGLTALNAARLSQFFINDAGNHRQNRVAEGEGT